MRSGTGRWVAALAACLLLCAQGVIGAEAKGGQTKHPAAAALVRQQQIPPRDVEALQVDRVAVRAPLGHVASRGLGIGTEVDRTYEDFQVPYLQNPQVAASDVGGLTDVHFVYEELSSTDPGAVKHSGYNVYDAIDGEWPQGQNSGCLLQPAPDRAGLWAGIVVQPNGLAVMTARDYEGESGPAVQDHDLWFQNLRHDCAWNQSWVPKATYSAGWIDPAAYAYGAGIASQVIGTDTVLHCVLGESAFHTIHGTTIGHHVLSYFRKVGGGHSGTWSGGQIIDTVMSWCYRVVAENGGPKVAVVYTNTNDSGWQEDNPRDNDVFYRESTDGGQTWGPRVNVTTYSASRTTKATAAAGVDANACYDSDGYLHIVWTAQEVPIRPYLNGWNWADFNADLFHWSAAVAGPAAGGMITKIADGTYDPLDNPGYWNVRVCGFGPGLYQSYIDAPSITFCNDKLYVIWNQMHSRIGDLPGADTANAINDCSAAGGGSSANWEIFLSASASSAGMLWGQPFNLSNTYTPNCAAGACGNEFGPSLSLTTVFDDGSLTWPANIVDPFGEATDEYLQVAYLDDEVPGSWFIGDNTTPSYNAIKWFRIPCGESSNASCIPLTQWWQTCDSPDYVINGESTVAATVTYNNWCDYPLNVVSIQVTEESGLGWLSSDVTGFVIPAMGSAGFDVLITPPPAGSGMQHLAGHLTLVIAEEDAQPLVTVQLWAGDDLAPARYDTVATSAAWDGKGGKGIGDNVALTVSNFGEVGGAGLGGVGLDFVVDGNDCDPTITHYLYGGSPFYMENTGSEVLLTTSHYSGHWGPYVEAVSWKPVDEAMTGGTGDNAEVSYDSVFTGKCVNRDATVAMERTFYAPRDNTSNPSFVVCKTVLYSEDGLAHNNIAFGTANDWDVPSDDGSLNTSGVLTNIRGRNCLYFQGTDTVGSNACQSNLHRYAAELLLGWNLSSSGDPCELADEAFGALAVDARDYFDDADETDEPNATLWWDELGANPGYAALSEQKDQGGFLTFVHGQNLGTADTLVVWTVMATMHNGMLTQFEANLENAVDWWNALTGCWDCPTVCGNIDASPDGIVSMADITPYMNYLYTGGEQPEYCAANVDGYPGLTNNDLITLVDYVFFGLGGSLDCQTILGAEYPQSNDVIELRNTIVPIGMTSWTVEVWMDLWDEPAFGFTFPFEYESSLPGYTVTLQDIVEYYDKSSGEAKFGDRSGTGMIWYHSQTDTLPRHVADLQFTIDGLHLQPLKIMFSETMYPPSHVTVLSRHSETSNPVRARGVHPHLRAIDDTTITPIGDAVLYTEGDTIVVSNLGPEGEDGVRVPAGPISFGASMSFTDVDLSADSAGLFFNIFGRTESSKGLQLMSGVGIYEAGNGTLQVVADYSMIGDPEVFVRVSNGGLPTGWATVDGGGVIAIGYDYGSGIPNLTGLQFTMFGDPTFTAQFSNAVEFHLTAGPTLIGDQIELISQNWTTPLTKCDRIDINGKHLVSFGLYDVDMNTCCVGMRGNADCSVDDLVTMGDLTVLIDHLFISYMAMGCPDEAELDDAAPVTVGDLTMLIDHLFITYDPLPACP